MKKLIKIVHILNDFSVDEFENESWAKAEEVAIDKYWSGDPAPIGRRSQVKLLWSQTALYVRFEANQSEPLVINATPNLASKTNELWNRDVCEIFIAPDAEEAQKYFEFEIAPTGEWIDIKIHLKPDGRITDLNYDSEMTSAAKIETDKIWMTIKVDWKAFSKIPEVGEVWKGNLLRCVGSGKTRGYLSWQPTKTKKPNFHVPAAFGDFEFTK
jgi:Carbohydrate family 9 binding domain-like